MLRAGARLGLKVPQITIFFWLIKLLTTATGEATSDFLVFDINKYLAVVVGFVALIASLVLQLSLRRYASWAYWLAVTMVAVFGTMAADVVHIVFGVPYTISTAFFATCLAVVLVAWFAVERTLSIKSVYTFRRELFYWATVMATFALGTAAGDLTAFTLGLGFAASVVVFAVLIAVPAIAYRLLGWNAIFTFWFAYVVTRPLGASIADWFGREPSVGGLGVGLGSTTLVLASLIVLLVAFVAITGRDAPVARGAVSAAAAERSADPAV